MVPTVILIAWNMGKTQHDVGWVTHMLHTTIDFSLNKKHNLYLGFGSFIGRVILWYYLSMHILWMWFAFYVAKSRNNTQVMARHGRRNACNTIFPSSSCALLCGGRRACHWLYTMPAMMTHAQLRWAYQNAASIRGTNLWHQTYAAGTVPDVMLWRRSHTVLHRKYPGTFALLKIRRPRTKVIESTM